LTPRIRDSNHPLEAMEHKSASFVSFFERHPILRTVLEISMAESCMVGLTIENAHIPPVVRALPPFSPAGQHS
jgi:hypothetical protein